MSESESVDAPAFSSSEMAESDRQWLALAAELTPAASLQAVGEHARWLVATVGTIGTLMTGFGLVSAGRISANAAAETLAILSFVAIGLALVIAMWTLRLRRASVNTQDLADVERWYDSETARASWQRFAGVMLVAAVLGAGATATVVLIDSTSERPTAELITRVGESGERFVSGSVACVSCDPGSPLTVTLVQVDGTRESELATAYAEVAVDGSVSVSLPEVPLAAGARAELVVNGCVRQTSGS